MTRIKAHPTLYKGVMFRSRLEAKWAAYFGLRGWSWIYEPFDLQGYTPDFAIKMGEGAESILVEVKPATKVGQLGPPIARMVRAWSGAWMVVGADPDVCVRGKGRRSSTSREYLGRDAPEAWAGACNLTQWMPTPSEALPICGVCGRQDHLLHKRVCRGKR